MVVYPGKLFFSVLIWLSLSGIGAAFLYQIYIFVKEKGEKSE